MTRKLTTMLATVLALTAATTALSAQEAADAETEGSWIHVRVDETDGAKVAVNLPMSLVDVALEIGQEEGFDEDDLRLDPEMPAAIVDALLSGEGDRLDLPAAARELARIGDQEVGRIDDEGTTVRNWVDRVAGARGS